MLFRSSEEQILAFNAEFESYDKQRMYGTDVITVLNKARDNNKRYEDDDSNYIDIAFKLKDDVKPVVVSYTWNDDNRKYTQNINKNNSKLISELKYNLEKDKLYTLLGKNKNDVKAFLDTSTEPTEIKNPKNPKTGENYTITYTGFSDFKRMIFKCNSEKIEYNKVGKICYMEFEQIKPSTY